MSVAPTNGNGNGKSMMLIGLLSLVVTVCSGAAAWVNQGFSRQSDEMKMQREGLDATKSLSLVNRERIDNLSKHADALDTALQREMRLINDETKAMFAGFRSERERALVDLDARLQEELRLRCLAITDRVALLEKK